MVSDMHRPEKPAVMIDAMKDIIQQVLGYNKYQPINQRVRYFKNPVVEKEGKNHQVAAAEKDIQTHVQKHQINVMDGAFETIVARFFNMTKK